MQGIYKIENQRNGKVYVGSSIDIERRWTEHRRALRSGQHQNVHLQRSWAKYGEGAFAFSVLETVGTDTLAATEQRYLDDYFGNDCYNMGRSAVAPMRGCKHTIEARRKISEAGKGRKLSEEHKRKIGEANKGNSNNKGNKHTAGYKHTEPARRKMSAAKMGNQYCLGRVVSDETRRKLSKAATGKQYGLGNRSRLGQPHTEETKRKMREAHRRRRERKQRGAKQ